MKYLLVFLINVFYASSLTTGSNQEHYHRPRMWETTEVTLRQRKKLRRLKGKGSKKDPTDQPVAPPVDVTHPTLPPQSTPDASPTVLTQPSFFFPSAPQPNVTPTDPSTPSGANPPNASPVGNPTGNPPVSNPTPNPPVGNPTANPPIGNPTANPPVGNPTGGPPGSNPTGNPPVGNPTANPPIGNPTANPPIGNPTANPPVSNPTGNPPVSNPTGNPPVEPPVSKPTPEQPSDPSPPGPPNSSPTTAPNSPGPPNSSPVISIAVPQANPTDAPTIAPTVTHPSCLAAKAGEIYVTNEAMKVTFDYELLTTTDRILKNVANAVDSSFRMFLASSLVDCSLGPSSDIQGVSPGDADIFAGGPCLGITEYNNTTHFCYAMEGSVEVYLSESSAMTSVAIRNLIWKTLREAINDDDGQRKRKRQRQRRRGLGELQPNEHQNNRLLDKAAFLDESAGIINLHFVSDERGSNPGETNQAEGTITAQPSSRNGFSPAISASLIGLICFFLGILGIGIARLRDDGGNGHEDQDSTAFQPTNARMSFKSNRSARPLSSQIRLAPTRESNSDSDGNNSAEMLASPTSQRCSSTSLYQYEVVYDDDVGAETETQTNAYSPYKPPGKVDPTKQPPVSSISWGGSNPAQSPGESPHVATPFNEKKNGGVANFPTTASPPASLLPTLAEQYERPILISPLGMGSRHSNSVLVRKSPDGSAAAAATAAATAAAATTRGDVGISPPPLTTARNDINHNSKTPKSGGTRRSATSEQVSCTSLVGELISPTSVISSSSAFLVPFFTSPWSPENTATDGETSPEIRSHKKTPAAASSSASSSRRKSSSRSSRSNDINSSQFVSPVSDQESPSSGALPTRRTMSTDAHIGYNHTYDHGQTSTEVTRDSLHSNGNNKENAGSQRGGSGTTPPSSSSRKKKQGQETNGGGSSWQSPYRDDFTTSLSTSPTANASERRRRSSSSSSNSITPATRRFGGSSIVNSNSNSKKKKKKDKNTPAKTLDFSQHHHTPAVTAPVDRGGRAYQPDTVIL